MKLFGENPQALGKRLYAECLKGEERRIEISCRAADISGKSPSFSWNESVWFRAFIQWLAVAHNLTEEQAIDITLASKNSTELTVVNDYHQWARCLNGEYVTQISDGIIYWRWARR